MNQIIPKSPISIRPAVAGDLAFIDGLQKIHSKNVGWMQTKAIETKIERGEILVAWASRPCSLVGAEERQDMGETPMPLGYCMAQDRYFKRDDVGIIYQMNIVPGHQRGLIGASLLKAQFERSAYGCKLYCCWCAQDIAANKFWEAMGFVPLAFRAGSEKKSRVHIFWQRRIRAGDNETPYWFPSQTTGGSIREDRLVLPIPPGTHWSEVKAMVLPAEEFAAGKKQLEGKKERKPKSTPQQWAGLGRMSFAPAVVEKKVEKVKEPKKKRKNDPKLIAAARELRDRWLEQVNAGGGQLPEAAGKYEVSRAIGEGVGGFFVGAQDVKQIAA